MKRVLLTGADSLVGSHILDQLLEFHLSVRALVASQQEAQALQQLYSQDNRSPLNIWILPTEHTAVPGAYDSALDGGDSPFDTVIHTVSTDPLAEADCLSRFITVETESLINFLSSVNHVAKGVERVIITNSLTPFARWLVDPQVLQSPRRNSVIPSSSRAVEIDAEYVLATSQASDNIVYDAVSKWLRDARVRFDLVTLTAPSIYGPSIRPLKNSTDLQEANRRIWNICSNDPNEHLSSPPYGINFYTDVRDLAHATVQAALTPQARNERFVISAGVMPSGSAIGDYLVTRFPELSGRVQFGKSPPPRTSGEEPLDMVDTRLAASILGLVRYRTPHETLVDVAGQIVELQRRKEWKRVIQS